MADKTFDTKQTGLLLGKFMDGVSTLEEERLLAEYFREAESVPAEWRDYREMFSFFDSGMAEEEGNRPGDGTGGNWTLELGDGTGGNRRLRRWAVAAAVAAAVAFGGACRWYSEEAQTTEKAQYAKTQENAAGKAHRPAGENAAEKEGAARAVVAAAPNLQKADDAGVERRVKPQSQNNTDVERRIRLQQAKIDSEIAAQTAEVYIAEYYARQLVNGEEVALPEVSLTLGDDDIPQCNIMTLIMQ